MHPYPPYYGNVQNGAGYEVCRAAYHTSLGPVRTFVVEKLNFGPPAVAFCCVLFCLLLETGAHPRPPLGMPTKPSSLVIPAPTPLPAALVSPLQTSAAEAQARIQQLQHQLAQQQQGGGSASGEDLEALRLQVRHQKRAPVPKGGALRTVHRIGDAHTPDHYNTQLAKR